MRKVTNVFVISAVITVIFIIWGTFLPEGMDKATSSVQGFIVDHFGWFYLISASFFVIVALFLIFSRYGKIKLGKEDDKPEYSRISWFAMLFSAGMGVGLVFWGVAEPISHFYTPAKADPETMQAAAESLSYTFLHWGLHPWAIYSIVALSLAYFTFRKDAPQLVSETLRPIIGKRADGGLGTTVNILAVIATIFGVATSLGLGAAQISGGLSSLTNIENNFSTTLTIIIVVTFCFMLSAITGINRGIKYLSNINVVLAILLMVFILFMGPTSFILEVLTSSVGMYIQNLPDMSLNSVPFEQSEWSKGWTIFYWAWWIAWSPFVGTFIARISKGRTIREFIAGVMLVPTIFGIVWFSVFGGTALHMEIFQNLNIQNILTEQGQEVALFTVIGQFPLSTFVSIIAIALIAIFFITSADSATFVLGMLTSKGKLNPANSTKVIWGIIQSATAAVLLWFGGLAALQTASIIAAFPFVFVMICMFVSLIKSLKDDVKAQQSSEQDFQKPRVM
ncbi:BCCT family transporter [Siminovitchia sp. 179-K 8D1 HS]|uniref:glycine betaine uptake BCCT transporter n=1 Tax=Siminovitchia sp. 179-K 8D1 HS TaxID=3142385 RepID=UPI0039A38129